MHKNTNNPHYDIWNLHYWLCHSRRVYHATISNAQLNKDGATSQQERGALQHTPAPRWWIVLWTAATSEWFVPFHNIRLEDSSASVWISRRASNRPLNFAQRSTLTIQTHYCAVWLCDHKTLPCFEITNQSILRLIWFTLAYVKLSNMFRLLNRRQNLFNVCLYQNN